MFCSAEGLWKAEENVKKLYRFGVHWPQFFSIP